MLYLLHPDDILKMAVKLESMHCGRTRYLVVVYHTGKYQMEESCLLGIDCNKDTTIGLVLPFWADTRITLDGDGGFSVTSSGRHHIFKPVSVQAMWSALQTLHKASSQARECNYFKIGGTHQWIEYYEKKISSDRSCLNEWHAMDDIVYRRPPSPDTLRLQPTEREETERHIRTKLKELMMSVDLDEVTSKYIRTRLEEILDMDLKEYKSFIDQEMLTILGQMDAPTEIFKYLYLGSEWNASNLEELVVNGIGHILNVTREIDNFFPGMFDYQNIRVYDDESTEILHYWDKTYRYIQRAKNEGSKVLVHCKMGISRSASVVIAYVMKAYDWDLQRALDFVKTKRGCIKPNSGFLKQLEIYQGILDASKQRHNSLWRSKSETNLKISGKPKKKTDDRKQKLPEKSESLHHLTISNSLSSRPKSWSPSEAVADMLFPPQNKGLTDIYSKIKKVNEGSKSTEVLSSDPSLPRVSSIKDRINELELQVTSDKLTKQEVKSPTSQSRSGLVFNLANQFESGSKPSSPVDEGLFMKPLSGEEIVQPVLSQTKPPICKHHAVLVKPSMWSDDGKSVPECPALSPNLSRTEKYSEINLPQIPSSINSSLLIGLGDNFAQDVQSSGRSQHSFKTSHSCNATVPSPPSINSQCKEIFNTNLHNSSTSQIIPKSITGEELSPANISDRNTKSISAPRMKNSITELVATGKSPQKNFDGLSPEKSPICHSISETVNYCDSLSFRNTRNYFYDKEDIPFTPGKVLRTKRQIEEKNLTRTTSFDSGFPYRARSNPSTPPESDVGVGKLIRRSHSLRSDCRPAMPFSGKWYPLPALASNAPFTIKKNNAISPQNSAINLSVSTPSVVEAVNRVICGTQEVLSSAIHFMPSERKVSSMHSSSDSDFEFGSATSLPEVEANDSTFGSPPVQRESPIPGLVRLQCELLENKNMKTVKDKCGSEQMRVKKDVSKVSLEQGCSLVISESSKPDDIKESGIVKRLKQELEAKSVSEHSKRERNSLSEVEGLEQYESRLAMGSLQPIERQTSAPNMDSSFENQPPRLRPRLSSSVGNKATFEDQKAPPTPHRKTSLDLSFVQKRFPLNVKLNSQSTLPMIKPNSRTTFRSDSKTLCEQLVDDQSVPSIRLAAKSSTGYIAAEIPPPPPICLPRKMRKQQGSTHPLTKLIKPRHPNPLYNTM
ncbi:uncharacterized protein [Parasteatoda tepidariorum]|nr:uncharacterized protein LOC107445692 [Parasteatoda tepidariorum]